jgi:hypothetical protein
MENGKLKIEGPGCSLLQARSAYQKQAIQEEWL